MDNTTLLSSTDLVCLLMIHRGKSWQLIMVIADLFAFSSSISPSLSFVFSFGKTTRRIIDFDVVAASLLPKSNS